MKLTFGAALCQVLLACPILTTAATIPHVQERTLAEETLNSPVADLQTRASCTLHTRWEASYKDGGYQGRRVKATAEGSGGGFGDTRAMLDRWCHILKEKTAGNIAEYPNTRCWVDSDTVAYAEVKTFIGTNGHKLYVNLHQSVVNSWRSVSRNQCDVDSKF